jgi:peptide-methionine (S)-S-oxide reductase
MPGHLPSTSTLARPPSRLHKFLTAAAVAALGACSQARAGGPLPAPAQASAATNASAETAILAGGCFWGVQGVFEHVRGVKVAYAGYDGGRREDADYETVSTGRTGHAETVKIVFDPRQISYGEVLRIFFSVATDPTQVNRQFPDEGPQYRSEIFYTSPAQQSEARSYIAQLTAARAFKRPIATRVAPDSGFYNAEGYHQNYLERHPDSPYIATYDLPKVAALKADFPSEYSPRPILVR